MRLKFGLRIALTLLPAGPAHPLFDNLELNTFSIRTLQIPYLTPFRSYPCAHFHFAYILFCTPNSLPSIACALFRKTRGVAWVSSHFGTEHPTRMRVLSERSESKDLSPFFAPCATPSTNHKSQVTNHE